MSASPSQLPPVVAVPHPTHPDAVTAAAAAAAVSPRHAGLQLCQGPCMSLFLSSPNL